MGVSHKPLFAPGRGYSYSNTNYVLAQLIVERVTGKSLGIELKRRIFQPLHLRDTIYPTKRGLPSPYAHGYKLLGKPPATDVTGLSPSMSPASGAIVSTGRTSLISTGRSSPGVCSSRARCGHEDDRLGAHRQGRVAGPGDGLGIGVSPLSCGGWVHSGELPGYQLTALSSGDGRRQVVLMVNQDRSTFQSALTRFPTSCSRRRTVISASLLVRQPPPIAAAPPRR